FAKPLPTIMICELLGVPYEARDSFQKQVDAIVAGMSKEEQVAGYLATQQYIAQLVAAKPAHPTDDVPSDLIDTDLTAEELMGVGLLLLAAGIDTTANMLAAGTFALLSHPAEWATLRAQPEIADQAVEELLRFLSVAKTFQRTALEDVELGGQIIRAGA